MEIAKHADRLVLLRLAYRSTYEKVLTALAASEDLEVQVNVAANRKTHWDVLTHLQESPNAWVRWHAGETLKRVLPHLRPTNPEPEPDESEWPGYVPDDEDNDRIIDFYNLLGWNPLLGGTAYDPDPALGYNAWLSSGP